MVVAVAVLQILEKKNRIGRGGEERRRKGMARKMGEDV